MGTRHLLLTLQGRAPTAVGGCERLRPSSLRLVMRGPRQKQARLLHVTLNYRTLMCMCSKKQSQDKKLLPKGHKEGVTLHSPNNAHCFWLVALRPALSHGRGFGPCPFDPTIVKTYVVL